MGAKGGASGARTRADAGEAVASAAAIRTQSETGRGMTLHQRAYRIVDLVPISADQ
jgi:hypothetical protein